MLILYLGRNVNTHNWIFHDFPQKQAPGNW